MNLNLTYRLLYTIPEISVKNFFTDAQLKITYIGTPFSFFHYTDKNRPLLIGQNNQAITGQKMKHTHNMVFASQCPPLSFLFPVFISPQYSAGCFIVPSSSQHFNNSSFQGPKNPTGPL
jgi:hypothetical protein